MKLVMTYSTGDGYTYSCDVTIPFEYSSKENAYVDFMLSLKDAMDNNKMLFSFANNAFGTSTFIDKVNDSMVIIEPEFYFLNEWFNTFKLI